MKKEPARRGLFFVARPKALWPCSLLTDWRLPERLRELTHLSSFFASSVS
jgi:hypothetical protein